LHAAIVVLAVVSAAFWLGFMRLPGERGWGVKGGCSGGWWNHNSNNTQRRIFENPQHKTSVTPPLFTHSLGDCLNKPGAPFHPPTAQRPPPPSGPRSLLYELWIQNGFSVGLLHFTRNLQTPHHRPPEFRFSSRLECGSLPREIATCCTRFSPVQLGLRHGIDVDDGPSLL